MKNLNIESVDLNNKQFVKNTKYYVFSENDINQIKNTITEYTYELDKVIPWENSNFVWSGGLLYDVLIKRKECLKTLTDIDLFFYGEPQLKLKTFQKILKNLEFHKYKYLVGFNKSIVYIFIQGVPRIIQLIFTSKLNPQEVIDTFDLTHLQSYWNGSELFSKFNPNDKIYAQLNFDKNENIKAKPHRLIKYLKRGVNVNELLYSDYNFILNDKEYFKLRKHEKQMKLYLDTCNLTLIDNKKINFDLKESIDNIEYKLSATFWCKIITLDKLKYLMEQQYYKENNKIKNKINKNTEFIDLIGDISDYVKLNFNGDLSNKICNLNIEDDVIEEKYKMEEYRYNQRVRILKYQTQKYIYFPFRIINNYDLYQNKLKNQYQIQIIKPRVIDFLIALSDDIYIDLSAYLKVKEDVDNFTHPFCNSINYKKIKQRYVNNIDNDNDVDNDNGDYNDDEKKYKTNGIINEYGLICKIKTDILKCETETNLYGLFEIIMYEPILLKYLLDKNEPMDYGFRLKLLLFDSIN